MKTEVLLRSIGKINDELIADAESEANTKRKPGWAKLGTMAACLALVFCTGIATHAIRSNATAGTFTMDVNRLLKSFEMLQQMTKAMTKGGGMRGLGGMMGGFGGKVARGAMHGFGRKKRLK